MESWRQRIRAGREKLSLSQREVAERAKLHPETVRGYENGRRMPTRENLVHVLDAVELSRNEANDILEELGFAPIRDLTIPTDTASWYSVDELAPVAERCPWPVFVVNEFIDVVAANSAFEALTGVDLAAEFPEVTDRNLVMIASNPRFADRVENWDEAVGVLIAVAKGNFVRPADVDEPSPYFKRVLERFIDGDPRYVARFAHLWDSVELLPSRQRWEYPIVWLDDEFGRMTFKVLVNAGDNPLHLFSFNDWIPTDAATWVALEGVKARRSRRNHRL